MLAQQHFVAERGCSIDVFLKCALLACTSCVQRSISCRSTSCRKSTLPMVPALPCKISEVVWGEGAGGCVVQGVPLLYLTQRHYVVVACSMSDSVAMSLSKVAVR